MKKIITLLFCTVLISSTFAQTNHHNDRRYNNATVYQNNKYRIDERTEMIQRINRRYDFRIQQISNDRYMNRREKKRAIKSLEAQKREDIKRIYSEYNNRYVYSNNRNHDDNRKERSNGNGHYNR